MERINIKFNYIVCHPSVDNTYYYIQKNNTLYLLDDEETITTDIFYI